MNPEFHPPTYQRHGNALLVLDEILALPNDADNVPGVYFLLRGSEIVYIGQSRQMAHRFRSHFINKRFGHVKWKWDSIRYLIASDGDEWEPRYIKHFQPEYNVLHK